MPLETLGCQESVTECAPAPVPDRATTAGEFEAVLTTETLPVALPTLVGAKTTLKLVFCPAARVSGDKEPLRRNPVPLTVAEETLTLPLPVLLRTTGKVLLLPVVTFPKLRLAGLTVRLVEPRRPDPPEGLEAPAARKATICMIQSPEEPSGALAL